MTEAERAVSPAVSEFVTVAQAAALLGRSTTCIRNKITAGELSVGTVCKTGPTRLRRSDVEGLATRLAVRRSSKQRHLKLVWSNPKL